MNEKGALKVFERSMNFPDLRDAESILPACVQQRMLDALRKLADRLGTPE